MSMHTLRPYTIPRGHHRPRGWFFRAFCSLLWRAPEAIELQVLFTRSCWYSVTPGVNDQLQKLVGYSRGPHHQNSTRIVWRPDGTPDRPGFALFVYEYQKGSTPPPEEQLELITVAYPDEVNNLLPLYGIDTGPSWGYRLWPHFEGPDNAGAPHTMTLYLATRLLY
jgi:hypothetical protein